MNTLRTLRKTLNSPTAIKRHHYGSEDDYKAAIEEENDDRKHCHRMLKALNSLSETHGQFIHNALNRFTPPCGVAGVFNVLLTAIELISHDMTENEAGRRRWLRKLLSVPFVNRFLIRV